jgi:hypothetical protein
MKRIILKESQLKKIVGIINEEQSELYYGQNVNLDINAPGVTLYGYEIDDITWDKDFKVFYNIEIEHNKFGVRAYLVDIHGTSELRLKVFFYTDDIDDNTKSEIVTIDIDWKNENLIYKEKTEELDYIGIDQNVEIWLTNNESGEIVVKEIRLLVNEVK